MKRPIAISLSPNIEKDDVLLTLKILFSPISWFNFRRTEELETEFPKRFGKEYKAIAVNSGRGALFLILRAMNLGQADEVALQALTCVVVPNSIRWTGARPIYVDVDNTFNLDPSDLGEKISEKTRAIIVQHSFGIPAKMEKIKKVVQKHNKKAKNGKVLIIEDCAVSLGAKYKNKKVGTLGDVSFFSFGRDKVISSVFGGMILTKDKKMYDLIKKQRDELAYPSPFWFLQQIIHPILLTIILPLYNVGFGKLTLGKILLFCFQTLKILSKAVENKEKKGEKPKGIPRKMPGGLAVLALNQLKKLEKFNHHRKVVAKNYFKLLSKSDYILPPDLGGSIWLRFPVLHEDALKIFELAKKRKILLGDWYAKPVMPVINSYLVGYQKASCKNAEKYAGKMLNLPTYPTFEKKDAKCVVNAIYQCQSIK